MTFLRHGENFPEGAILSQLERAIWAENFIVGSLRWEASTEKFSEVPPADFCLWLILLQIPLSPHSLPLSHTGNSNLMAYAVLFVFEGNCCFGAT